MIITMTIKKTIYNCYKFHSNLFFLAFSILSADTEPLVCVDLFFWRAHIKCYLNFFSIASFCNSGHFVHSSDFLVERDCSPHIVKHISTHCNNFSAESVLEQGI